MLRFISTTAVLLLLTACGWHLRGVTPLPAEYKVMYVEGQQTDAPTRHRRPALRTSEAVQTCV